MDSENSVEVDEGSHGTTFGLRCRRFIGYLEEVGGPRSMCKRACLTAAGIPPCERGNKIGCPTSPTHGRLRLASRERQPFGWTLGCCRLVAQMWVVTPRSVSRR